MRRTRDQVIWDFVQDWLGKAQGDLRAAEHLLELDLTDYFTAAFHAQQAAEKFLKAFLVRNQIPFPKTHDIRRLLDLCSQADPSLQSDLLSAAMLTPFGVEFRYPGQVADRVMASQAVEEAKRVCEAVLERLEAYLKQGRPPGRAS
jgi:HEPN domain-containing protein